jgi:hypothetical protein
VIAWDGIMPKTMGTAWVVSLKDKYCCIAFIGYCSDTALCFTKVLCWNEDNGLRQVIYLSKMANVK